MKFLNNGAPCFENLHNTRTDGFDEAFKHNKEIEGNNIVHVITEDNELLNRQNRGNGS